MELTHLTREAILNMTSYEKSFSSNVEFILICALRIFEAKPAIVLQVVDTVRKPGYSTVQGTVDAVLNIHVPVRWHLPIDFRVLVG